MYACVCIISISMLQRLFLKKKQGHIYEKIVK